MENTHQNTRAIYHKQHTRLVNDDKAMKRISNLYTKEYFALGENWFEGKKVLDAGCGDTIVLSIKMHQFGAEEITSMDLGDNWIENANKQIDKHGLDRIKLVSGNVLELPFEDNSFDFVACNGVLCHVNSIEEVKRGFAECVRVCKPGGFLYSTYAVDGGLLEKAILPAMQKYYHENEDFKDFIDNISSSDFENAGKAIFSGLKTHMGYDREFQFNKDLFDEDLCVTIQNYIQGPNRYDLGLTNDLIKALYEEHGFDDIRRLRRFDKRTNIRKFLAPLQYERDNYISKILWGNGFMEYIAQKK